MIKSGQWWVDPFAGGGSIPHERYGSAATRSPSDPKSRGCLILKVLHRGIPRYGLNLAEETAFVGDRHHNGRRKTSSLIFYPKDPNSGTPSVLVGQDRSTANLQRIAALKSHYIRSMWL